MKEVKYWFNRLKETDEEKEDIQYRIDFALWGAANQDIHIAKFLLANGADVNSKDFFPLSRAVLWNHIDMVIELIRAGADVNKIVDRSTALKEASVRGYTDIVKVLLNAGADVNVADVEIICNTAFRSQNESLKLLLDAGGVITELTSEHMYVVSMFSKKTFAILQSYDPDWFLPLNDIKYRNGDIVSIDDENAPKCGICLFPCNTKYVCCGAPVHNQCGVSLINFISGENATHYCYKKCIYNCTLLEEKKLYKRQFR
jgi:hypothetical protein